MATTSRMDLNRHVREWLSDNWPEFVQREDLTILAARPHFFETKSGLRKHQYHRWTFNIQVHGKFRSTLKDFLMVKCGKDLTVEDLFLVPFDIAMQRKTAVIYESIGRRQKRLVRGWISNYRLEPR